MLQSDKPYILLVNDDGVMAPGLAELARVLNDVANVTVVAPASEMSAVGHAITLKTPLRVEKRHHLANISAFAVNGTPADCVKIAVWSLLERKPDLVISGINLGSNTGINALYSGTVAAASEAAILGIPAFALSLATFTDPDFNPAARLAVDWAQRLLESGLPHGQYLNINVPAIPLSEIKGTRLCRQGMAMYREEFHRRTDPHGGDYYWLSGQKIDKKLDLDVDEGAVQAGYVAVTPMQLNWTAEASWHELQHWNEQY